MPSNFEELVASHLDPYIDLHFGGPVRFLPMLRTPNGRPTPDSDRRESDAIAVLHLKPHRLAVEHGARAAGAGRPTTCIRLSLPPHHNSASKPAFSQMPMVAPGRVITLRPLPVTS